MSSAIATFFALYLPLILALVSLLCLLRLNKRDSPSVLTLQPFGIFGISFPVNSMILARVIIALAALGFPVLYAFYDFSVFFPKHLLMQVFYDAPGLNRVLHESFTPAELSELGVSESYATHRREYFDLLDKEGRSVLGNQHFFSVTDGDVHSSGETSFVVSKIDGWQRYYIQESKGELIHVLEMPHRPTQQFYTLFEKMPTANDYIDPSATDLTVHRRAILRPKFKQLLAENRTSKGTVFNVALTGLTRVTIFPWPKFSPTVYCADLPEHGMVPFAYAIYR